MNREQISRGQAQDPLNYLQRQIIANKKYSKRLRQHLAMLVRKAKLNGPYDTMEAIFVANHLRSYGRRLYIDETLDQMSATDKGYKDLTMAACKWSEDSKRNVLRSRHPGKQSSNRKSVPTARARGAESEVHEAEEADGETA